MAPNSWELNSDPLGSLADPDIRLGDT